MRDFNSIKLWLRGNLVVVYGGPYIYRPKELIGVKMAKEINKPCHIDIPTVDFSVPDKGDLTRGVMRALIHLSRGDTLYVGCMGGIGRTGLFMAVLAKALGHEDPIAKVRLEYSSRAVETMEQVEYINNFKTKNLTSFLRFM